jgi:hypothetical protein
MAANGDLNTRFGVYTSLCCGLEIVISEGARFPDCPKHPHLTTTWKSTVDDPIPHVTQLPSARKQRKDPAA